MQNFCYEHINSFVTLLMNLGINLLSWMKGDQMINSIKNTTIVYHYCSIESLFSIISNQSLWLTSLSSSNDQRELEIAEEVLQNSLKKLTDQSQLKTAAEKLINFSNSAQHSKTYQSNYEYYALSFVNEKDSLTHWERYGNQMQGVSIAFNINEIENLFSNLKFNEITHRWLRIVKVLYTLEEQIEYANEVITALLEDIFITNNDGIDTLEDIYEISYNSLLATLKPIFKHKGFAGERECRLYFEAGEAEKLAGLLVENYNNNQQENQMLNISNNITSCLLNAQLATHYKKYGLFGGSIRSYFALNLEKIWCSELIPEIILAPRCHQSENELRKFLDAYGLSKTLIRHSTIPIR